MSYQQSFDEKISTNVSIFPNIPQIRIKNPLKKTLFVNAIELLPDSMFTQKGDIYITIGRGKAFSTDGKPLGAYSLFPVPLENQEFLQGDYIEIFARNAIDTNVIELSVNIKISETQGNQARGAQPLDVKSLNDSISPFESIFPLQNRQVGIETLLIFTKGYKTLVVLISSPILDPSIILPTSNYPETVDTSFITFATLNPYATACLVTYPSIANRIVKAKVKKVSEFGPTDGILQYSTDDITYFTDDTQTLPLNVEKTLGSGIVRNARYWRISLTDPNGGSGSNVECYEVYNSNDYGGTASVNFEIKGVDGNWITYIPSSEFGTAISIGSNAIASQVGDVSNLSVTGKAYKIPSDQTRFRIKLSITNGSVYNSVGLQKVS